MRVLYLSADPGVPVLGHKGASVHVRGLVEAFGAAGVAVLVASPRTGFEGDRIEREVELVEIDPVLPKAHASAHALRRGVQLQAAQVVTYARARGVDAIYERYSLFSNAGVLAAEALGIPHVLEVNAPLREEARRFRVLPHAAQAAEIEAGVLAATDRVFAVSEELRDVLVEGGLPASKVEVLPNAVDPARFMVDRSADPAVFTVGFCGSLKPWHGVDVLFDAFEAAAADEPRLRIEIVGAGAHEALVAEAAARDTRIVWHGSLPHRAAIATMARWDVGVAPFHAVPRFYFSPLKVLEYMAVGLCVVASDLGQIRTLLGGDERGVLVTPGDANALAAALLRLAGDPEHVTKLGSSARRHVLATHTWERNAERVLETLVRVRKALVA